MKTNANQPAVYATPGRGKRFLTALILMQLRKAGVVRGGK